MRKLFQKVFLQSQADSLKNLKKGEKWQWLNNEQLNVAMEKKLKVILSHSYNHIPYYRKILFEKKLIKESGEVDLDRFFEIPLLSREALHAQLENLTSEDVQARKWFYNTSGGSTGIPVKFIQDKNYVNWREAVKLLYDSWSGCNLGDRKVILWGSERDLFVGKETFRIRAIQWMRNSTVLNAFLMTPEKMRNYASIINNRQPTQIRAYAESMYEIACFLQGENIKIHSPRSIMTSAGTLYPYMRETIENVFRAPVFNRYGSREMGDIACECEYHNGLHISPMTHFVEILDKNSKPTEPGELGEIIVTCLTNFSMPLIRYRIGDMGSWNSEVCPCGRRWPLLKEVSGRVTDTFIRRDGSIISPEYLIHLIGVVLNKGWIKKYQIIQEDYEHILVRIVLLNQMTDPYTSYSNELKEMTKKIQLVMGKECDVGYKFPNTISPTSSGKYRFTISKIERKI